MSGESGIRSNARAGHQHPVPVVRGRSRDELPALVARQVVAGGREDPGLRVELQPLAGELLEHVVRDHDHRLADHPEAPQLAGADDHLRRLSGADLMEQADRRLGQDPGDGGALVGHRRERPDQAGQAQPLAFGAVVAQHDRVEPAVVLGQQPLGALGVLPAPFGEPFLDRLGLLLGRGGLHRIHDPAAVVDLVGDLHHPLLKQRLGDRGRRHPAGAPLAARGDACVVAPHAPHAAAGALDLERGIAQDRRAGTPGARPRRSRRRRAGGGPRRRPGPAGGRAAARVDVHRQLRAVRPRPARAASSFSRTFPDRYSAAGSSCPSGVSYTSSPELCPRALGCVSEQLRDRLKLDAPAGVQADRQRVLRGVGAENRRAGRDDSLSQQRRRLRLAGLLVEHLEADARAARTGRRAAP